MLVVTRKEQEAVILTLPDGRTVRVIVVEVSNRKVRLGIEAPADVKVWRDDWVGRPDED